MAAKLGLSGPAPQTGVWFTAEDSSDLIHDVGEASCADLLVTPVGDVYATGGGQLGWLVRKRPAGASTFTTVDVDYSGKSSGAGWGMTFHPTRGLVRGRRGQWPLDRAPEHRRGVGHLGDGGFHFRRCSERRGHRVGRYSCGRLGPQQKQATLGGAQQHRRRGYVEDHR